MPRAPRKVVTVAEIGEDVVMQENTGKKNGKRPAEDSPDGNVAVPPKAARRGKSKQPFSSTDVSNDATADKTVEEQSTTTTLARSNSKRAKKVAVAQPLLLTPSTPPKGGTVHCFGTNDCGQLGFQCEKRKFPALVPSLQEKKIVAVACGGMHTVALEDNGKVWTFGLNDDKALGRHAEEEEEAFEPGTVDLPAKATQISAGDSHSAALTVDGHVYAWGCFKDDNGNFGLIADDGDICREKPENITSDLGVKIVKISSGAHHIAMLGEDGQLYTCGTGEQGQLGREQPQSVRVTRSMGNITGSPLSRKEYLLKPAVVKVGRNQKFNNIWTGEFSVYCSTDKNEIYVCGLNNYSQLGLKSKEDDKKNVIKVPTKPSGFKGKVWKQIAAGQHHTIALDEEGKVYALGRNTDGRLGMGDEDSDNEKFDQATLIKGLEDKKCVLVAAGGSTSYAITEDGHLYAWGFGENFQLASGDEDDRNIPSRCIAKGNPRTDIEGKVIRVDAGGQHVALTIELPRKLSNGDSNLNGKH